MYALVFWLKSKTTSVISEENIHPLKDEGESTFAKYKDSQKLYRAKIVKLSDDKEYLKRIQVDTDGEIMKKNKNIKKKEEIMKQKKDIKKKEKELKRKASETVAARYERLLNLSPIFDGTDDDIGRENDQDDSESNSREIDDREESDSIDILKGDSSKVPHKESKKTPVSPIEDETDEAYDDPLDLCRRAGNVRVQLCACYNVWMDKGQLTYLQRFLESPKKMIRRLLKVLCGVENLKKMCAKGRSKDRRPVPEDIMDRVEYYVNKKCSQRLKPAEFTNVVNFMCGTLRCPRK